MIPFDFIKKHNIHYVAHDDAPYATADCDDGYGHLKKAGMFMATKRTEGISTSDIIMRIIKEYDMYVKRSMERGYSRRDIGISQSKMMRIKLKDNFQKWLHAFEREHIGQTFDRNYANLRETITNFIRQMTT